jgi:hypothetical protein
MAPCPAGLLRADPSGHNALRLSTALDCLGLPQVWDIARERLTHICSHHSKGVHSYVWCRAFSVFASCGIERDVIVWQVGGRAWQLRAG